MHSLALSPNRLPKARKPPTSLHNLSTMAQRVLHLGPVLAAVPLVALRILAEERVISTNAAYVQDTGQVRWHLIPLVW